MRTPAARRAFVKTLEGLSDDALYEILKHEGTDELCALNEYASPRLKLKIQREIRNTDG